MAPFIFFCQLGIRAPGLSKSPKIPAHLAVLSIAGVSRGGPFRRPQGPAGRDLTSIERTGEWVSYF